MSVPYLRDAVARSEKDKHVSLAAACADYTHRSLKNRHTRLAAINAR